MILDKGTNSRIELPVLSECSKKLGLFSQSDLYLFVLVINHVGWTNFVSDMPAELHRSFNEALNKRFANRELVNGQYCMELFNIKLIHTLLS